jgi:chloramphenicol O-acetyltransferase type A
MRYIDLETYPRRSHYEFFKAMAFPYVGMTANEDVTGLLTAAKKLGGSAFLACLWAAANAANAVPELRQRIVGEQIVEYDHCDTAHTVALPDGTFVNCQTDCRRSFRDFLAYGKQCQEAAKQRHGFVQPGDDETRLIFVSSTPWVTFTQVIQPTPIPADSNVRIVFGKFFDQNGRKMLPVNIQCNHALVDGFHVAQFFQKFQELADSDLTAAP